MRNFTLLLLLSIFNVTLQASYPDCFMGSIELLYFKPTVDQSFYIIDSANTVFNGQHFPDGKRINNSPRFQPGFRLEGFYGCCDHIHAFDCRFTYLNEGHSDSTAGDFLFDTIGYPGDGAQTPEDTVYSGKAKYLQHFRYYGVDGTFNRFSPLCCPESFSFFLGAHFAYIKFHERASSNGTSDDTTAPTIENLLRRNSHFWGLGPQFGIDYRHLVACRCGSFSLRTNARVALLASHTWADLHYNSRRTGPVGVNLNNEPLWRITPCIDVKAGFAYECPFRCLNMTYELGYEMIWYSKAVDAITGYDVAFAGNTIDLFSNLNLQGPYFAARASF